MTLVRFKMVRPSSSGPDVPAAGLLRLAPTRVRVVDGDPDAVVLPAEYSARVPESGLLDLELAATAPSWCWTLKGSDFGTGTWIEYLSVPEPVADPDNPGEYLPVDYPDLVRVDPETLEPSAEPDPAWWAFAESMAVSGTEAVAAAASAGVARDESVAARDAAGLSASGAAGSADAAAVSAGEAQAGATVASTQAGEASASRALAEAARDSTVAAAGGSELSAAQASSAAIASAQSAADAEAAALDVVTRANNGEFKGDQGLPGNATMRVDTTVGTRVFITDGTTERMVFGDTGWRAVAPLSGVAPRLQIRRVNNKTVVWIIQWKGGSDDNIYNLPAGFGGPNTLEAIPAFRGLDPVPIRVRAGNGIAAEPHPTTGLSAYFEFYIDTPWPTTLPGTPA